MGILGKLQFWKRDDLPSEPAPYDLGAQQYDPLHQPDPLHQADPLHDTMNPDIHQDPFGQQFGQSMSAPQPMQYPMQSAPFPGRAQMQPVQQQAQVPEQYAEPAGVHPRDIELILAKLDGIKSELDALHQRVRKIEQATDQPKKYW